MSNNNNNWTTAGLVAVGVGAAVAIGKSAFEKYQESKNANCNRSSASIDYQPNSWNFSDEATTSNNEPEPEATVVTFVKCPLCNEHVNRDAPECQEIACGHKFHRPCLVNWIREFRKVRRYCPECCVPI